MTERLVAGILLGQLAMFVTQQVLVLPAVIGATLVLDAWLVWRLNRQEAREALTKHRLENLNHELRRQVEDRGETHPTGEPRVIVAGGAEG